MPEANVSNPPRRRWLRWLIIGVTIVLACIAMGSLILVDYGPLSRGAVTQALHEAFSGNITIGRFESRYLPYPGCLIEDLLISRPDAKGNLLVVKVSKLTIEVGPLALLSGGIDKIHADGLLVRVPRGMSLDSGGAAPKSARRWVKKLVADNSVVEFERRGNGENPLRFEIHRLSLGESGRNSPILYRAELRNPTPRGEISASGEFGPWRPDDPGQTTVSGSYTLKDANLDGLKGIAGTLSSQGQFHGVLRQIEVSGVTDSPNFEVKQSRHRVQLSTRFKAIVNGTNGETRLQPIDVRLERMTALHSEVAVKWKGPDQNKRTTLEVSGEGRIQDLLRLFVAETPPDMSGAIDLRAAITLPPGPSPFLQRLRLKGDFTIRAVRFSKETTQAGLDGLSARAGGEKLHRSESPPEVRGETKGEVDVKEGVAAFSQLDFEVPGASAQLHGTFNLLNQKVNLHGELRTEASLSQETRGIKAALLKPLDPLFKRKRAGAQVGVSIGGTYGHPSFGIDLNPAK